MADARAYATWARLEREFALGEDAGHGALLLPRHSAARFTSFIEWMARDRERRALLPLVRRATGIYVQQTRLVDWGADATVGAQFDRLGARAAEAPEMMRKDPEHG